ncbi:MAG: histidinol dehydrogenase [Bacteroidota bacterium]|jgi:histidinol dehydrogenase
MQIIKYPEKETWSQLVSRPELDSGALMTTVSKIISDIKTNGDVALFEYINKFDPGLNGELRISDDEIKLAANELSHELKDAIDLAFSNITRFHDSQADVVKRIETFPGVICWRQSIAIERVGLYIPGGTAPLFSTVLMLGIPAQLAGCKEVVLCTPANNKGEVNPAILYAAQKTGITEIYKVGGAQAIAAMGIGTESIPKVDKIFGPGNQYVTAAKQLVQLNGVAIDMPAGPSEVCILADATANPAFIAADLLSQAEHGIDSQVFLVSESEFILTEAILELQIQLERLERKNLAASALENSKAILVQNMDEGLDLVNAYAAEHLIIASDKASEYVTKIKHAGSVFLGNYTPESAGDYASGTNHTLPTNGYARAYSGVSFDSFIRKVTFQQISAEGIKQLGQTIITMAEAEGLDAHAEAVRIRIKSLKDV